MRLRSLTSEGGEGRVCVRLRFLTSELRGGGGGGFYSPQNDFGHAAFPPEGL